MSNIKYKDLLNAGVHFGHMKRKWNPKMSPYIFMERKGIHIIDLNRTIEGLENASRSIKQLAKSGKKIMFVATKKQARDIVKTAAESVNMPYGYNLLRRSNYYRSMFFSFGIPEFLLKESVPSFVIVFFQVVMLLPISIILLAHNKYSYISLSKLKSYAKEVCNN